MAILRINISSQMIFVATGYVKYPAGYPKGLAKLIVKALQGQPDSLILVGGIALENMAIDTLDGLRKAEQTSSVLAE